MRHPAGRRARRTVTVGRARRDHAVRGRDRTGEPHRHQLDPATSAGLPNIDYLEVTTDSPRWTPPRCTILKNGTASQPITMRNHDERVIIDGENMPYTPGAVGSTIPRPQRGAIHIEGDHWRLIGLAIKEAPATATGSSSAATACRRTTPCATA